MVVPLSLAGSLRKWDERLWLTPKVLYFSTCLVFYTFYVFRAAFMEEYLGMDKLQYGNLSALMSVAGFVGATGWSWVADRFKCHRLVLCVLAVLVAGSLEPFPWVRTLASPRWRYILDCSTLILYGFLSAGLIPLTDFLVMRMVAERSGFSRELYSRQLLFGTVAYGVVTGGQGYLLRYLGNLAAIIWVQRATSLFCLLAILACVPSDRSAARHDRSTVGHAPKSPSVPASDEKATPPIKESPAAPTAPLWGLLTNASFLFMVIVVFLTGTVRFVMNLFLPKYWQDTLRLDQGEVGLAAVFGVLFELLIFFVGPWLVRGMGVYWLLLAGQGAAALRTWIYAYCPGVGAWSVYGIELMKGLSFGFTQLSGTKIAVESAPAGLQATALAVYGVAYSQLPSVVAAVAGGYCLQAGLSHQLLFKSTAGMITISCLLCTLKYAIEGKIRIIR